MMRVHTERRIGRPIGVVPEFAGIGEADQLIPLRGSIPPPALAVARSGFFTWTGLGRSLTFDRLCRSDELGRTGGIPSFGERIGGVPPNSNAIRRRDEEAAWASLFVLRWLA
jgi:hypothetical protein